MKTPETSKVTCLARHDDSMQAWIPLFSWSLCGEGAIILAEIVNTSWAWRDCASLFTMSRTQTRLREL